MKWLRKLIRALRLFGARAAIAKEMEIQGEDPLSMRVRIITSPDIPLPQSSRPSAHTPAGKVLPPPAVERLRERWDAASEVLPVDDPLRGVPS